MIFSPQFNMYEAIFSDEFKEQYLKLKKKD